MKYITTDKHPELKEGVELHYEEHEHNFNWFTKTRLFSYMNHQKDYALEKGYIKELQEPEFTKDDMIEFAKFAKSYNSDNNVRIAFDNWVKGKD